MNPKLILASSSPRRQDLLKQVNIPYSVRVAHVDESVVKTSNPVEKVRQLAKLKGRSVSINNHNEVIISADTVVACNGKIFEKPKCKDEAHQMISSLSGNVHEVLTGVTIRSISEEAILLEKTQVEFWTLSKKEIEAYIATDEPYDKAGGYGIQSLGAIFVKRINGDYNNVVGLPVSRVIRELKKFGLKTYG